MCQVWSAVTGELVQSMRGHSGSVTGVRVLDTGEAGARVVSASSDCSVRVWYVPDGQSMLEMSESLVTLTGHR